MEMPKMLFGPPRLSEFSPGFAAKPGLLRNIDLATWFV